MTHAQLRASVATHTNPNLPMIERLAAEFRSIFDEEQNEAFLEALDAETDVLDITDRLLAELVEAEAWETAAKAMAEIYTSRVRKLADVQTAIKRALGAILDATGERKIRRAMATVSRTKGVQSVLITDEESVPTQLSMITRAPDKAAILRLLKAGEPVPGAEIQVGAESVAVRR